MTCQNCHQAWIHLTLIKTLAENLTKNLCYSPQLCLFSCRSCRQLVSSLFLLFISPCLLLFRVSSLRDISIVASASILFTFIVFFSLSIFPLCARGIMGSMIFSQLCPIWQLLSYFCDILSSSRSGLSCSSPQACRRSPQRCARCPQIFHWTAALNVSAVYLGRWSRSWGRPGKHQE